MIATPDALAYPAPRMGKYHYISSGVTIESNVPLDQMRELPRQQGGLFDLSIELCFNPSGEWPGEDEANVRPYIREASREKIVLEHAVHGRIEIQATKILVEVRDWNHWEIARTYVLGTALAVSSYQRRQLTFHCSAVSIDERVYAFSGEAFSGKTTWAGVLLRTANARLVSDDTLRIDVIESPVRRLPIAWPALRRLRLRPESLPLLNSPVVNQDPQGRMEWYGALIQTSQAPLAGIFELEPSDSHGMIDKVIGIERVKLLWDNLFRREYGVAIMGSAAVASRILELAKIVPCYRFRYQRGEAFIERNVEIFLTEISRLEA